MSIFSDNLAYLKKARKISQEELGKLVGVGRSAAGSYERGLSAPNMTKQMVLADFFGVSIDDLLRKDLTHPQNESINVIREPQSPYGDATAEPTAHEQSLRNENELLRKQVALLEKHIELLEQLTNTTKK
jgi:transcriptional regulator with XRE-family HTH domain